MSPKLVRTVAHAARCGALALAALVGTSGCENEAASTPAPTVLHTEALLAPPGAVAMHAQYPSLSEGMDAELTNIVTRVVDLPPGKAESLRDELLECLRLGRPLLCLPSLQGLGISLERFAALQQQARTIVTDEDIDTTSPQYARTVFMGAQEIHDPIGPSSELTLSLLSAIPRPCGSECAEQVGYGLGVTKGATMARMSQPAPTAGDDGGGGGGGGGSAGTAIAVIGVVIEVLTWIEDLWWNSDEEDKACESDDDCPSSEYCHTVGDNDCRDKLDNGQLCSRSGQCESDRCRVHISCGFLPCCRP